MDELWDRLVDYIVSRPTDPEFWTGFVVAVIAIVVIVLIVAFIQGLRKVIDKFFEPSKVPAAERGPSSADKFRNCACATVSLFLLALIAIVLVAIFIFAVL